MTGEWLSRLADFVLPRCCCICGQRLGIEEEDVCTSCLLSLPYTAFMQKPYDNEMAQLFWGRVTHMEKAAALIFYQHTSVRNMLFDLKYRHRPDVGEWLGRLAAREMARTGFAEDVDCIVPMPLAPGRERERGYNQCEVLGKAMGSALGIPVVTNAVRRTAFSESQTAKERWQRFENVKEAFVLKRPERIAGRHVLLVDDVVTTGATMCACAAQLDGVADTRISMFSVAFVHGRTQ